MWRHHDLILVPDLTGILRRDYLIVPRPWTDPTPFDIPNMKDASWQGYHSYNYIGIGLLSASPGIVYVEAKWLLKDLLRERSRHHI
jgi:hypothetical protein